MSHVRRGVGVLVGGEGVERGGREGVERKGRERGGREEKEEETGDYLQKRN